MVESLFLPPKCAKSSRFLDVVQRSFGQLTCVVFRVVLHISRLRHQDGAGGWFAMIFDDGFCCNKGLPCFEQH